MGSMGDFFDELYDYSLFTLRDSKKLEIVEKRLKIIKFFDKYGAEATREAFGVARSTVYLWKKKLKDAGGKLIALVPKSKAPKNKGKRETHPEIIEFIRRYRLAHPRTGQEAIKVELDEYCRKKGLKSISVTTIARIIRYLKDKNLIPDYKKRLSFYARTCRFVERRTKRKKKLRPNGYKPKYPGDLVQIDSTMYFFNGIKRYIIGAIDLKSRFGFCLTYSSLSSASARDFIERLMKVSPFPIRRVQTDNGSEFEKYFREYLEKHRIVHFYNYPRYPRGNGYIERFFRTIKEQYIYWNTDGIYDIRKFNENLIEYLIWYNTKKPHTGLNKLSPVDYLIKNFSFYKSKMLWNYTWT